MPWLTDIAGVFFWHNRGTKDPGPPHDMRDDETVDEATGIGEVDGQILDNTSIDPDIQDKLKGFPNA